MPFFDDTGARTEERHPLWSAFSIVADQLERLIVLNVVWAVQWIPALIALGWSELPAVIRVVLIGYSLAAYAPATIVLYGMARSAAEGEPLINHMAVDLLKQDGVRAAKALVPLVGLIGALVLASSVENLLISAAAQLGLLLLAVISQYWGALIAAQPVDHPVTLLRESARLVWRYPFPTMLLTGAVAVAVVLGVISIGGLFLIVPVVIALLQTEMLRYLREKGASSYGTASGSKTR